MNMANTPKKKNATGNQVVYKVVAALVLLCVGLVCLNALRNYYALQGWRVLDPLRKSIVGIGFGLCALSVAAMFIVKKPGIKMLLPWLVFIFALVGMTGVSMLAEDRYGFSLLFFLWSVVLVQYIIYQLYRWEFFLFSLPTAVAGFLFYRMMKTGLSFSISNFLPLVLVFVLLVLVVYLAWNASKHDGSIVVAGSKFKLFSKKYNPFLHYLMAALWTLCIVASFILGGTFAFYCMFATIAVEFIAAVYYTFQLN